MSLVKSVKNDYNLSLSIDESHYINSKSLTFYRKVSAKRSISLIFAGRGNISRDNCGQHYGFFSCRGGHKITHRRCYCYQMSCPICFHKALTRNSKRILKRFTAIHKEYRRLGHKIRFRHYSFNTLWKIDSEKSFDKYRNKLISILNKHEMNGLLVFHAYRKEKISKKQFERGVKPQLVYFPHFHFIGFGFLPHYDDFRDTYKFTYTNITEKHHNREPTKYPKYLNKKSVYLCARYVLSHCSFKNSPKAHSYFWVGNMNPQRVRRVNEIKETVPILCDDCEEELNDGKIYKIHEPEFTKTDVGLNKTLYVINVPYQLDTTIYLVKKVHKYDLRFKNKRIKDHVSGRWIDSGIAWGPSDKLKNFRNFG